MSRPVLGIIGGMGPQAAAVFSEKVVLATPAKRDQDHIDTLLWNQADIPPRVEYILETSGTSPGPVLRQMAEKLISWGADYLAMPCVTAHYFYEEIAQGLGVPFLHIVKETAAYLRENGVQTVGLLATVGTLRGGHVERELRAAGIQVLVPDEEGQALVTDLIFRRIKRGQPVSPDDLEPVILSLKSRGAGEVLLACTDLSVANHRAPFRPQCLDMLEVYARAVVAWRDAHRL